MVLWARLIRYQRHQRLANATSYSSISDANWEGSIIRRTHCKHSGLGGPLEVEQKMSSDNLTVTLNLALPLADGRTLVQGPLTYNTDGLATRHNADFVRDPSFVEAYRLAMGSGHPFGPDLHVEWRIFLPCWAAYHARHLEGDLVECGVAGGMTAMAVAHYIGLENLPDKTYWLLDTFEGYPTEQLTEAERSIGLAAAFDSLYGRDTYDAVKRNFQKYSNVRLVKGKIPDTLERVTSERIAYLCVDLNAVVPEMAVMEYFWDRLEPGAIVILDDYGWTECINQKIAHDQFAERKGVKIFPVPSGQGMLIKPPR
jgi:O-methyltransferase